MGVFQSNVFQHNVFQGPFGAVPTTFVAGGTIVAHRPPHGIRYTRDDHVRLKKKRRREDLARERLLASLSELELAQLMLAEVEAALAPLAANYSANPTKEAFNKIADLTERRDQLALKVSVLTEQEARAQAARDLADQQATKEQADAVLAEIQRQQLAGRVSDINMGAANSIAPQQIAHAMQMARLMHMATAPHRAQQEAARMAAQRAQHEAMMRAALKAKQEEDDANELINLGMQWTNQS